jgi:hypothetical protein
MSVLQISRPNFDRIISVIGYPVTPLEELDFEQSHIKDVIILDAVQEYFRWFPIVTEQSAIIPDNTEIVFEFPTDNVMGVDFRVKNSTTVGRKTSSPFANELIYRERNSKLSYTSEQDYQIQSLRVAEQRSKISMIKGIKKQIDYQNRTLAIRSAVTGEVIIKWSSYSNVFEDIPFQHQKDVRELAQAYLLSRVVLLRSQLDGTAELDFDTSTMENKANELEEKIMNKWKSYPKVAIIR